MTDAPARSTDGFTLGEILKYRRYREDGRVRDVVTVRVIEIRQLYGLTAAIGETVGRKKTESFWLYARQRAETNG
jgi:hypothetical protein